LATLQPDQYEYVTWPADQALVIQGNPGTGKTIVAAHRAAYLVSGERDRALGRVLLVGPTLGYKAHVSEVVHELATERQVRVEGLTDLLQRLRGLKMMPGGALEGKYHEFDDTIADDADMVAETLRDRDPAFNRANAQEKVRRIYECLRANDVLGEPVAYVGEVVRGYKSWPEFDKAARERRYVPVLAACGLSADIWKSRWFDHVIVDEAQDVRPLEWRLLSRINRGRGWTIIGDVYQRRWDHSYRDWGTLIAELGLHDRPGGVTQVTIERGYRSTKQIMRFANQLLPAEGRRSESLQQDGPDPVVTKVVPKALADKVLAEVIRLCDAHPAGTVAVVAPNPTVVEDKLRRSGWLRDQANPTTWLKGDRRVSSLGSEASRGLEFDAVVVVEPEDFPQNLGIRGQLYTSLTRANRELAVVHSKPLPDKMKARV
jgi:DNA helicase IV